MKRSLRVERKSTRRIRTKKEAKTQLQGYLISIDSLRLIDQAFAKLEEALALAKKAHRARFKGVKRTLGV